MKFWKPVIALAIFLLIGITFSSSRLLSLISKQGTIQPKYLSGTYDGKKTRAVFNNKALYTPLIAKETRTSQQVLGKETIQKRIEVDLTNQRLYAYEDDKKVYDFLISSGKWGATPTGIFKIWIKLKYTLMTGGSQALGTYYYLPNVPFTMYFYNDEIPQWRGFGIHGTYWHDNFGHPMSHGCINMKTEEAEILFSWAQPDMKGNNSMYASETNPGTEVFIYGTAPNE